MIPPIPPNCIAFFAHESYGLCFCHGDADGDYWIMADVGKHEDYVLKIQKSIISPVTRCAWIDAVTTSFWTGIDEKDLPVKPISWSTYCLQNADKWEMWGKE